MTTNTRAAAHATFLWGVTAGRDADGRGTERKTKMDWAQFIEKIASRYEAAEKITLVMDNLNSHASGSLYEAFVLEKVETLWARFDF